MQYTLTRVTSSTFSAMMRLMRATALVQERVAGELASIHGVDINEALLLLHLEGAPLNKLTRTDLAKRLHLSASTVTRMAMPMEKTGLVSREADPRDARLAYVVLTEAGRTVASEVRETLKSRSGDFFKDRWEDDEVAGLANLLGRLTASAPGDLAS